MERYCDEYACIVYEEKCPHCGQVHEPVSAVKRKA